MNEILSKINSLQVTRLYKTCNMCGLPESVCMCREIESIGQIEFSVHLHVLMHENELKRNTNTGRIPGMLFCDNTSYYIWKRKEPCRALTDIIESGSEPVYLLFPSSDKENAISEKPLAEGGVVHLIIIDGTWQEASKIVRQSPYLSSVKRLVLPKALTSDFRLRKNQKQGNLCTAEAISASLEVLGEHSAASILKEFTKSYLETFVLGRNGHKL